MTIKPSLVRQAVYETPWAVLPSHLAVIVGLVDRWAAGVKLTRDEIDAAIGRGRASSVRVFDQEDEMDETRRRRQAAAKGATKPGSIAVLGLKGTIAHRMGQVDDISSSGTSTEGFGNAFRAAVRDSNVASIVIDVDSPGGSVEGVPELADEIFAARGEKPIIAVAEAMSASAAYWIASAADEFRVTQSGEVGSIGVFAAHQDFSEAMADAGIKTTFISAGKFKTEGNAFEPLSKEAKGAIQARVDDYYNMFVDAVARHRDVTTKTVREGFGQGRMVGAADAFAEGMVDRVAGLGETVQQLMAPPPDSPPADGAFSVPAGQVGFIEWADFGSFDLVESQAAKPRTAGQLLADATADMASVAVDRETAASDAVEDTDQRRRRQRQRARTLQR